MRVQWYMWMQCAASGSNPGRCPFLPQKRQQKRDAPCSFRCFGHSLPVGNFCPHPAAQGAGLQPIPPSLPVRMEVLCRPTGSTLAPSTQRKMPQGVICSPPPHSPSLGSRRPLKGPLGAGLPRSGPTSSPLRSSCLHLLRGLPPPLSSSRAGLAAP